MADNSLPNAEDLFPNNSSNPTSGSLPNAEDLFPAPQPSQPISGKLADYVFGSLAPIAKAATTMAMGAQQGWGAGQEEGKEITQALTKAGIYNDYNQNKTSTIKSYNEALFRPVLGTLLPLGGATLGTLQAGLFGLSGAATEVGKKGIETLGPEGEAQHPILSAAARTLGEAGEIGEATFSGEYPEVPVIHLDLPELLNQARSIGAVGEGEEGFFNTKPISEENIKSRQQAATDSGLSPADIPTQQPVQTDIHSVVRQMDPVLFQEYDKLLDIRNTQKDNIEYAKAQDIFNIQRDLSIEQSRAMEDRPGYTELAQSKIDKLQDDLKEAQLGRGPLATAARDQWLQTDYKIRDMAEDVSSVYNHARDIMMTPDEIAKEPGLTNQRLQELDERMQNIGLTKQEWIEYQTLTNARDQAEEKTAAIKQPTIKEETKVPQAVLAEGQEPGGSLRALEGTGETRTSGVAKTLEDMAIKDEISKGFDDMPEYKIAEMQPRRDIATKLVVNNPEEAERVATGKIFPPEGVHPEDVLVALTKYARLKGDSDLIERLANGKISREATIMGQRIGAYSDIGENDPVRIIRNLNKAYEKAMEDRGLKPDKEVQKVVNQIQDNISKGVSSDSIKNFLKSIECDY